MTDRQKSYRRKKRRGMRYFPIMFLLVFLALVIGLSVFFRVSSIEVVGAGMYSEEEIISASGISEGDNLFFISESSAVVNIRGSMNYIDEIKITRKMPDKVIIEISESYPIASIRSGASYWIIDKNCKLLESVKASEAEGTISIKGVEMIQPVEGNIISLGADEETKELYLQQVLSSILKNDIQKEITYLDVSNISSIEFDYQERFTVEIGTGDDVDEKISMLLDIVKRLEKEDSGKINVSKIGEGHFYKSR